MLEKVFDPQGKKRKTERYDIALMSFLSSIHNESLSTFFSYVIIYRNCQNRKMY